MGGPLRRWRAGSHRIAGHLFALSLLIGAVLASGAIAAPADAAEPAQEESYQLAQDSEAAPSGSKRGDLVLKGDAVCTRCHDEAEAYPVLSIARTKHGTRTDQRNPTCTSCHGESPTHVTKPAGASVRPPVDRQFSDKSPTPPEVQNGACLACHEGTARMFWHEGAHAARDVTCTSCHQIHTGDDKVRIKSTQAQVCFTCHKEQRLQISKPYRHPILENQMVCSDCHNPHGSPGPKLMVRATVNDTCFQCHAEKRGPFIWNHMPVTENCSYCHNPHGTTVAGMLKWRTPFLCQQCHEPTSHRGNVPNLNITTGTGGTAFARGCLNCHTNIHGGSNPTSSADSRSLRR